MAIGESIRCRLRNDGPIARSVEERRIVARTVLELGRPFDLLGFGLADTHLHAETGTEGGGAELARRVEGSLTRQLGYEVGFERARVDPVDDIWHLYNLFAYVLRQGKRHGVQHLDPLLECTNVPDLLGLRCTGRYTAENVRRLLPRVRRGQLLELLEVPDLTPYDSPLEEIPAAAAAAVCRANLAGKEPEVVAARRAAIAIVGDRLGGRALSALLGLDLSNIFRQRQQPVDPELERMIRLQLGLRRAKSSQATGSTAPIRFAGDGHRGR
jgi:hypothetical protein